MNKSDIQKIMPILEWLSHPVDERHRAYENFCVKVADGISEELAGSQVRLAIKRGEYK